MKVKVLVDVMGFNVRAFTLKNEVDIPLQESARIAYFESGNEWPNVDKNIFDILPKPEQERLTELAGQLGINGIRGTTYVEVPDEVQGA